MCHVLVLGADKTARETISAMLGKAGHKVVAVSDLGTAQSTVIDPMSGDIRCVVIDETVPGVYKEFVRDVHKFFSRMGVVVLSPDPAVADDVYNGMDVWSILPRNASAECLLEKVEGAYEYASMSDTTVLKIERDLDNGVKELKSVQQKIEDSKRFKRHTV